MANRRKEIPSFVSIEVGVARSIAEAMTDDEWGKWSKKALDDLSIGCTRKDTDARVRNLYEKAKDNMDKEYLRKKEWYENRKAQGNQLTADGDTREDSLNMHGGSNAVTLESGTSANIYATRQAKNGDAPHSEAGDESATVSKNMRRVPQNEAPAHGFSGGRTAQGTMSRSPEAAAQSGKDSALDMPGPDKASKPSGHNSGNVPPSHGHEDGNIYDQVPDKVSTGEKRTGGHSPLSQYPSSRLPVRDRHAAVDVLNLAYAGEFGNVRLTQEQYAELGIRFGNQQKLNRAIDSLSCKLENEEIKPRNHYAELLKWAAYRDDMDERKEEEASKPKMTEMEKSWIAAMKRVEAM